MALELDNLAAEGLNILNLHVQLGSLIKRDCLGNNSAILQLNLDRSRSGVILAGTCDCAVV